MDSAAPEMLCGEGDIWYGVGGVSLKEGSYVLRRKKEHNVRSEEVMKKQK